MLSQVGHQDRGPESLGDGVSAHAVRVVYGSPGSSAERCMHRVSGRVHLHAEFGQQAGVLCLLAASACLPTCQA